ncbi:S8 family serine peptidase [Geitlerinema sp. CS-897]|nr:S8 family serine peptidase [Geitlerinema sp. CS-897]
MISQSLTKDVGKIRKSLANNARFLHRFNRSKPLKDRKPSHTRSRIFATLRAGFVSTLGIAYTLAPSPSSATSSTGEGGIDAQRLHAEPYNLLGRKIGIGQVEIGRPAQFGLDKDVPPYTQYAPDLAGVFMRDAPAQTETNVDAHAHSVAGVMVSNHKEAVGVAPEAQLYSAGAATEMGANRQAQECATTQHVALQNSDDVRAINFSFGEPLWLDPRDNAVLDGNAHLTLCIDWSANQHDVLYVIAGNQGNGGIPIPTDNFNGVNVAFSRAENGVFDRVDVSNLGSVFEGVRSRLVGLETNIDGRRLVSLLAPGRNVDLLRPDGTVFQSTGTSFAAPHVAGVVALLQEYGDRQLSQNAPNWSLDSRRHQVMKAVLLNSADKVQDSGNGLLQGMTRTIGDRQEGNWLTSDAHNNPEVPLHRGMGTGHLNAFRAYQQFSPGQWGPSDEIPAIGWDFDRVETNNYRDYVIDEPLQADSYVAATLTWSRRVDLDDANGNGLYDQGETFSDRGLNDLDLYLMPADSDDISDSIWSSTSPVDSVEHVFHAVPETGRYKLRVVYNRQVNDAEQDYALAWWTVTNSE